MKTDETRQELLEWLRVSRESLSEVNRIISRDMAKGFPVPEVAHKLARTLQDDIKLIVDKLHD